MWMRVRLLLSVGPDGAGPVVGSASKMISKSRPFLWFAPVTGLPGPTAGGVPPGEIDAECRRNRGPEKPWLVASGGMVTHPCASGWRISAGIDRQEPGGGPGGGGGNGAGIGPKT